MRFTLLEKIIGVTAVLAVTLLVLWIWSLNTTIKNLEEDRDGKFEKQFEEIQNKYNLIQTERDSLLKDRSIWIVEKVELEKKNETLDSLWNIKADSYEEQKNRIVRDGTVVDIAQFLTDH